MTTGSSAGTRTLLLGGILVGPFYLAVGLAQALARDGFDLGRHALSLLANGPGGSVQTANFVISGLLVVGAAIGLRRTLGPGSKGAGWILGWFGVSMLLAAVFPADPVDGFPPGTPEGMPAAISTTGLMHFAAGATGFLALAVSAIAVGMAMASRKEPGMARLSFAAGFLIIGGFLSPAVLPAAGPVAGIWLSVVVGWAWLAVVCAHLRSRVPAG